MVIQDGVFFQMKSANAFPFAFSSITCVDVAFSLPKRVYLVPISSALIVELLAAPFCVDRA